MEGISKKISIRGLVSLYALSYILQSFFFVNRKKVYAAENTSLTNIVAIFVDKEIYPDIQDDIQWYTTQYIQKKLNASKAIVLPINTKDIKAFEISKMLENMYFDGIQEEPSKLIGTVLIGDIPLPVIKEDGYIYPSIFPYVDFEKQQFIFDANQNFFIPNNNPNGQAEIWHGIIDFNTATEYHTYFTKLKTYYQDPEKFIDTKIRYDDLIATKQYMVPDNINYYVNNQIFAEDKGYHRFTNLMFNTLKEDHNTRVGNIGASLENDLQDTDEQLKAYGEKISQQQQDAQEQIDEISTTIPTSLLSKSIQEISKTYDEVINTKMLAKMKENVSNAARRYKKNSSGVMIDDINSHYEKVAQKDTRILGNDETSTQPLLIQFNTALEQSLNTAIEENKYYMNIPIPLTSLNFVTNQKRGRCIFPTYDYYQNYYFGQEANSIQSAQDISIYRGTYQNLKTLSGQQTQNELQSIGASYKVFSTQVEANRKYNFNNAQEEITLYNTYKTNKLETRKLTCPKYLFGRKRLGICIKTRVWNVDDYDDENKCYINDPQKQGGCETVDEFSFKNRGGASPINFNKDTQQANPSDYRNAKLPIYDIAGSKATTGEETNTDSYLAIEKYTNLIQNKFGGNAIKKDNGTFLFYIRYPGYNGNTIPFPNVVPTGDLDDNPTRTTSRPKTYAQTNFFTKFSQLPNHIKDLGKAVVYRWTPNACMGSAEIYTYKTIDSRVQNISPTRDQISSYQKFRFKSGSTLENFYINSSTNLTRKQQEIQQAKDLITISTNTNSTGINDNLLFIKNKIQQYNIALETIENYNTAQMSSLTTGQIHNLANLRAQNNINTQSKTYISGFAQISIQGLETLGDYFSLFNLDNVRNACEDIIQTQAIKNDKVELLSSRKTDITTVLNTIKTKANDIKTNFTQTKNIYQTTQRLADKAGVLQNKKAAINALQTCGANGPCGCNYTYKEICDTIENIKQTLIQDRTTINESIDNIQSYPVIEDNQSTTANPMQETEEALNEQLWINETNKILQIITAFPTSNQIEAKDTNKGINITTTERPIDSIRNITFQGIGGTKVQLNYPNLYEVPVYTKIGDKAILKSPEAIRESIKTYMKQRIQQYNEKLQEQTNKKGAFYQTFNAQFDFLQGLDPLATPNRNYGLLPQDFFITNIIKTIDRMTSQYGKEYIFGTLPSTTTEDKLLLLAKILRYQNSPRTEKKTNNTLQEDIKETQNTFNINQKIGSTINQYLQKDNNQGAFLSPKYNKTGYEVAFINSDGNDLIQTKDTPAFIQNLETIQQQQDEKSAQANKILQQTQTAFEQSIQNECGIDPTGTALLFDVKTGKSPWINALKCRRKKTAESAKNGFNAKFTFKSALGPVRNDNENIFNSAKEFSNNQSEWKSFGQQINTEEKNQKTIDESSPIIATKLKNYLNTVQVKIQKETQYAGDTENNLAINISKANGPVKIKVSGTGDVCLSLDTKRVSLCEENSSFTIQTDKTLTIKNTKKQTGTSILQVDICVPNTNDCISKIIKTEQIPGTINKVNIKVPTNIIPAGGELPVIIQANDSAGNGIHQDIQLYTISVNTGTINGQKSIQVNSFGETILYEAPKDIQNNTTAIILFSGTNMDGEIVNGQQSIIIAKAHIQVRYNNQGILSQDKKPQTITYRLPDNETILIKTDAKGIPQIQKDQLPKINIQLQDKNGNTLDSIARITSKYGLVTPGTVKTSEQSKQNTFQAQETALIQDGTYDLYLYPNFKVGNDELYIEVPGIPKIILPIQISSAQAYKVIIQTEKENYQPQEIGTGKIVVLDYWNNKIQDPTTIKIGSIGPGTINDQEATELQRTGQEISFKFKSKANGGEGYLFAYIKEKSLQEQSPGYQNFFIQKSVLPETNLNVMYLNLFGTDWGNQRGYFSDNNKKVNQITKESEKVLITTTQLIDPGKIKQIQITITPQGQIQNNTDQKQVLYIDQGNFQVYIENIVRYTLGKTNTYKRNQIKTPDAIESEKKNILRYIPEQLDSIISGNTIKDNKLYINNQVVMDLTEGTTSTQIEANNKQHKGYDAYDIIRNNKKAGEIYVQGTPTNIQIQDTSKYEKTPVFTEGSTNGQQGIGIYSIESSFTKNGYVSIQDSKDPLLGIGFTNKFKNISYFAQGKSAGEATLPYGSAFLINFGDPLVQRVSESIKIDKTDFDGAPGQSIFSDPNKTIFKAIPTDMNNDGLQDIIIAYTDGSIKLAKNYGGKTVPYTDLQELMIIADSISDIKIGDTNGDKYPDIIIQTTENKIIVYKNNAGIMEVDGTPVCLNTNQEGTGITANPDRIDDVYQLFIEDMDKDGSLDIITNEANGDINIFYGGKDSKGRGTYLSTKTGICDSQWFERQKYNYQHVKRIGIQIKEDRLVTDESIVHRKDMPAPDISDTTDKEDINDDTDGGNTDLSLATNLIQDTTKYLTNKRDLLFTQNPFEWVPEYEKLSTEKVTYLPISQLSGDDISIYKQYKDLNGGILQKNDKVHITTTILALRNNTRISYAERINGPRNIQRNQDKEIPSLLITGMEQKDAVIYRNGNEDYLFAMDNIQLEKNQSLKISYDVVYRGNQTTNIQVKDIESGKKTTDGYPDISIQSTDACLKNKKILFNKKESSKNYKSYEEYMENIQGEIDNYLIKANEQQTTTLTTTVQQSQSKDLNTIPGMSSIIEQWSLNDIINPGGLSLNFNMDKIDQALAGVNQKLDQTLQGLCEGFSLGKKGCNGLPIPFNQAFGAPGDYHFMGCVPGPTSPLYGAFKTLNNTLGKGVPVFFFPGTIYVAGAPVPFPRGQKNTASDKFLRAGGGIFPSLIRIYVAPTLTMGMGIAICGGPYTLGTKLPKPFRDIAGNCVVFGTPAGGVLNCDANTPSNPGDKQGDEYDPARVDASTNGVCTKQPSEGNRIVFTAENGDINTNTNGTSSPLQITSQAVGSIRGVNIYNAASSSLDNGALFPQGNFGGIIEIDQSVSQEYEEDTTTETTEDEEFELKAGDKIKVNPKILGAQTKGLVKCLVKDWMTRQVQYVINNLTKMTVQVDLPDMTQITQGFGDIPEAIKSYQETKQNQTGGSMNSVINKIVSKKAMGENPFKGVMKIFEEVPLINLTTKDINLKIPLLSSDEITKYRSYLNLRVEKNQRILDQRDRLANELTTSCKETQIQEGLKNYNEEKINNAIETLEQEKRALRSSKATQQQIQAVQEKISTLETIKRCKNMNNQADKFTSMRIDATQTIKAVQANIKILDEYKKFPFQLYDWLHVTDRYLAETTSVLSQFTFTLNNRLQTNANRYSQYVDAITLIIGAIKTRQAIINFSVNWSEKCSTCTNDNYGSFSCSLSFLCPQLPIFKIPPFKIPDIHLDLSHVEAGIDIVLPKFNLIPIKMPLPQLPNIPEPPNINVHIDIIDTSLPKIPVLPGPPQLPELPSFIPNIEADLPILPPAPKIPKILPEINATLKVAEFIGKIFCIVKGGIGLVGEKGVKGKIEQITQRTRNVPAFDFFDLTTKYKNPPLQGFDYSIDAYTRLKYNFDGVYTLINNIADASNKMITENIEKPIGKGINDANSWMNTNIQQNIDNASTNIDVNIQGFMQSQTTGELAYADAYKKLNQGLFQFKTYAKTDKATITKIQDIQQTINTDSKVNPATKEINDAKDITKKFINNKRDELHSLTKRVQNYDALISDLKKDTIQLVSDTSPSLNISIPLMKISQRTKDMIENQESPTKTYLDLNKGLIKGYLDTLEKDGAEKLAMSNETYQKSKTYLTMVQKSIEILQQPEQRTLRLAQSTTCPSGTCTNTQEQTLKYQPDISTYAQGVFVQTGAGTGKTLINIINNEEQISQIGKKYISVDINNDKKKDMFMRDSNNVYIKYAQQNMDHASKGGNKIQKTFSKYYIYQGSFGKRRIESSQDIQQEKGFAQFGDVKIKIRDTMQEVKNFTIQGQSFDTIQIAWKNSSSLGEDPKAYIIRYTDRIENFFERIQTFSFFGNRTTQRKYIIILPKDTPYMTGLLNVDTINKKPLVKLLSGEVTAIKYFDPNQEKISISLYDMPKKWIYAQIATLQNESENLTRAIYSTASPRSNQIVVGNQILGDSKPPEGEFTLQRDATQEQVSTGNNHQGYINTRYTLKSLRQDDVVVQNMSIEKNGKLIFQKTGTNSTGSIAIDGLFFTGATKEKYIFTAKDANNNIAKEEVVLQIQIPKIEIIKINQKDKETSEIIAKIQNDIDEGMVSFQRTREKNTMDIKGTEANPQGGYLLSPKQTIITGGFFSFGNTLGLYQNNGVRVGSLDPENGKISIRSGRENTITIGIDFFSHIPKIIIQEKSSQKKLFQISLPSENLVHIKMHQGKPKYEIIQLKDKSFQAFTEGYCIKNQQNECIIYISPTGKIYVPGIYASTLQGNYGFNTSLQTIQYIIQDENAQDIATIDIKTQNILP